MNESTKSVKLLVVKEKIAKREKLYKANTLQYRTTLSQPIYAYWHNYKEIYKLNRFEINLKEFAQK